MEDDTRKIEACCVRYPGGGSWRPSRGACTKVQGLRPTRSDSLPRPVTMGRRSRRSVLLDDGRASLGHSRNVHELVDVRLECDLRPSILLSAFRRRVRRDRVGLAVAGRGERFRPRSVAHKKVDDT